MNDCLIICTSVRAVARRTPAATREAGVQVEISPLGLAEHMPPVVREFVDNARKKSSFPDLAGLGLAADVEALARMRAEFPAPPPPSGGRVTRIQVDEVSNGQHTSAVRVYVAAGEPTSCPIVFAHGGGWVAGHAEHYDRLCTFLAESTARDVYSVEYRLAPEHPHPAALDDVCAVAEWVAQAAHRRGAPGVLLCGVSAGAHLVAYTALKTCDRVAIAGQVLIYPVLDPLTSTPSHRSVGEGFVTTSRQIRWFWQKYSGESSMTAASEVAPFWLADLRDLPPTLIACAELDPLRDEGQLYARELRRYGVPVRYIEAAGTIHGFVTHFFDEPFTRSVLSDIVDWIRSCRT